MPVPLVRQRRQSSYCVCLCKYISTFSSLPTYPSYKWKLNLYLPLPIPFQILFSLEHAVLLFPFHPKIPGYDSGWGP